MASLAPQGKVSDGESTEAGTDPLPLPKLYAQRWSSVQAAESAASLVPMATFVAEEKEKASRLVEEERANDILQADTATVLSARARTCGTEREEEEGEGEDLPVAAGEGKHDPSKEIQRPMDSERPQKEGVLDKAEDRRSGAEDEGESTVSDLTPSDAGREVTEPELGAPVREAGQAELERKLPLVETELLVKHRFPTETKLGPAELRAAETESSPAEKKGVAEPETAATASDRAVVSTEREDSALRSVRSRSEIGEVSEGIDEQGPGIPAAPLLGPSVQSPIEPKISAVPAAHSPAQGSAREVIQSEECSVPEVPSAAVENSAVVERSAEKDNSNRSIGFQETRPKGSASVEVEPRVQSVTGQDGLTTSNAFSSPNAAKVLDGTSLERVSVAHKAKTDNALHVNQSLQSTDARVADPLTAARNIRAEVNHPHTTKPVRGMSVVSDLSSTGALVADQVPLESMRLLVEDVPSESRASGKEAARECLAVHGATLGDSISGETREFESEADNVTTACDVNERPATTKLMGKDATTRASHAVAIPGSGSTQADDVLNANHPPSTGARVADPLMTTRDIGAAVDHPHTTKPVRGSSDVTDLPSTRAVIADQIRLETMRLLVEDVPSEPHVFAKEPVLECSAAPGSSLGNLVAGEARDSNSEADVVTAAMDVSEQPASTKLMGKDASTVASHSVSIPESSTSDGLNRIDSRLSGPVLALSDPVLNRSAELGCRPSDDCMMQDGARARAEETTNASLDTMDPCSTSEQALRGQTLSHSTEAPPDIADPSGNAKSLVRDLPRSGPSEYPDVHLVPREPGASRSSVAENGPHRKASRSQRSSSPSQSPFQGGSIMSRDGLVDSRMARAESGTDSSSACENLVKNDSSDVYHESDMSTGQQPPSIVRSADTRPSSAPYCNVCKLSFTGPSPYKQHLAGAKHRKSLNRTESTYETHDGDRNASPLHDDGLKRSTNPNVMNALGGDPRDLVLDSRLRETDWRIVGPDPRLREPDPRLHEPDPRLRESDPRLLEADPRFDRHGPHGRAPDPRLQGPDPRDLYSESRFYDMDLEVYRANPRSHAQDPHVYARAPQQTMPYASRSQKYALPSRIMCEICDVHCRSSEELSLHLGSHQHAMRLQYLVSSSMFGAGMSSASFTAASASFATPHPYVERETYLNAPRGSSGTARPTESFACDPCDFMSNSEDLYTLHLASTEHNVRMSMPSVTPAVTPAESLDEAEEKAMATLRCDICSAVTNTPEVMKVHLRSQKHARKLIVVAQASSARWKCDLCRSVMSCEAAYDAHMKGKLHANMLKRTQGST